MKPKLLQHPVFVSRALLSATLLGWSAWAASALPIITAVVETGGDNEATDTVTAKWTGVTFSNGISGEFLNPFTVPVFGEDVPAYVDRTHQWNGATTTLPIPYYLVGGEYIMCGNDNRDNTPYQLDITVSKPALVYVLVDNRLTDGDAATPPESGLPLDQWTGMAWLAAEGFVPVLNGLNRSGDVFLADEVGVDESGDGVGPGGSIQNFSSIYSKQVPAGTFSLYQADNGGRNMYGVVITAVPDSATLPPKIDRLLPLRNTPFYPAANGVSFAVTPSNPNTIATSNITLILNGKDVSADLTITGDNAKRSVAYKGLVSNLLYFGQIVAKDDAGHTTTNLWNFDTFLESNYMIEAEDFNFSGGQFIDNPVLSSTEAANNYINKVGVSNIDRSDPTEGGASHVYRGYDTATGTGEVVGTEIIGATEYTRKKFTEAQVTDPGVVDYNVGWVDVGEWWNYTRTFPAGAYKVYARLSGNSGRFEAQMDLVAAGGTTTSQVTVPMGMFIHAATGNWQQYVTVPLQDAAGNDVIVKAGGKSTVRFTTKAGGLNANFFMLVPATPSGALIPFVSSASPSPDATGISPDTAVNLAITDQDTKVQTGSLKLYFNAAEVTGNSTLSAAPNGATVKYVPPAFLTGGFTNTIAIVFSDNATPANTVSNQWQFVVANLPVIPASYAKPVGSGQTPGFTVRASQQQIDAATTTDRTERQLSGAILPLITQGFDTPLVINYWGNSAVGNFPNDESSPNFPGVDDVTYRDNIALEAIAYIPLERGVYRFGVNSDDGFRLTTGTNAQHIGVVIGELNAGRGAADSDFDFVVEQAGVYPFRLTFNQGGGGYEVELSTLDRATGKRTLINAADSPIKAYRFNSTYTPNPVTIVKQPANQAAFANRPVTLTVGPSAFGGTVTNPALFFVQWQLNGVDVPGGVGASWTIAQPQTTDSGKYRCNVTLLGYPTVTSTEMTLTVTDDRTPPKTSLLAGVVGSEYINVLFDEPVEPSSAATMANYVTSVGTVTNAVLTSNSRTVVLGVEGLTGTNVTLTISGVQDLAGNVIAKATTPVSMTALAVNLQSGPAGNVANSPTPAGYLPDIGLVYGARGNGWSYGWDVDNTANARYRQNTLSYDLRYDTFNHMLKPLPAGRVWEIGVPNGTYLVYVVAGEASNFDETLRLRVEGELLVDWVATTDIRWADGFAQLSVNDGRLTVTNDVSAANNKLAFLNIYPLNLAPSTPPTLSISRSADKVVVAWPIADSSGFVLEGTASLSPSSWSAVTAPVVPNGTNNTVTLPANAGTQFLRLKK